MTNTKQHYKQSMLYKKRLILNQASLFLSICAMGIGIFFLGWILYTLFAKGLPGLHWSLFTSITPVAGEKGGVINAIFGSFIMVLLAILMSIPIGICAGIYLSEYADFSKYFKYIAVCIRFVNDILLSAPSIIIGIFVYTIYVIPSGHFSGWAGIFALSILAIPLIVRTTENMLDLVPVSMKEAASALGAPRWRVILMVALRNVRAGVITGILLAVARISGETAPLLFTSLNNAFWSTHLNRPIANLPVVIFQFAMSPYEDWQSLAWASALLMTMTVLGINIISKVGLHRNKKL